MATISEGADVHTLIVMFTVDPTQQETLVDHLRGMAAEHCEVRRSLSRAPFTAARTVHASRSTPQGWRSLAAAQMEAV
jgi:hypothetical protein